MISRFARGCALPRPMGAVLFVLFAVMLSLAAPRSAQAQGATCTINWGTVAYGSTNNPFVMSPTQNPAVLAACDPRYPNVDSGVQGGSAAGQSTGDGSWTAVTNIADNTLTYTPAADWVGPDSFIVYFCGAAGCPGAQRIAATVNVTVAPPTLSMTAAASDGVVAAPYSQTLSATGGAAPFTFSVIAGALPPGLSLTGYSTVDSRTGSINLSGTPTAGGTFSFTIQATDATRGTGPLVISQAYSVTIAEPTISVSPVTAPNGTQNSAYSQTLTASGGTAPYSWSVTGGALPAGMTLSAAGVLSGTPTQSGSFTFTAQALDSSTGTGPYAGSRAYTFNIAAATPVANAVSATVAYGSANNPITLNITGAAPDSVAIGTAPANGTAIAAGTTITYTPNAGYGGPDSFTYTASNVGGTSPPATVTITVSPPTLSISPAVLPDGLTGVSYNQSVSASGGASPYTYSVIGGALPGGLSLDADSGAITGDPTGDGVYAFTIEAEDSSTGAGPYTTTRSYSITITTPDPPVAGPVSATVAYGSANNPIPLNLTGGAPTSVAIGTAAANGTAIAAGTAITYTPNPGYFGPDSFTYTATNADGTSAPGTVTITVNPQPPTVGAVNFSVNAESTDNAVPLVLGGGPASSLAVTSPPASGSVTIAGAGITYSPDPGFFGTDSFTYTATNAGGASAPATVTITVNQIPPVAHAVAATAAYGSADNPITLNITGGAPVSVAISTQATNGAAVAAGASITYTPDADFAGTDTFAYTATNSGGTSAPATVTVTVTPPAPPVANAVSATVTANSVNNAIPLSLTGGPVVSLSVPTAPTNGTVNIAGTSISYTPTAGFSGADSFTYAATNPGGTSAPAVVSVTVTAPTLSLSAISLSGDVAQPYNDTITASLGTAPYAFALTAGGDGLPTGMTLSPGGGLSGTPTTAGTYNLEIEATDVYGAVGVRTYPLVIAPPTVAITAPAGGVLPGVQAGASYSQTFTATGGVGPHTFALTAGALPPGLSLTSGGALSGTPTASGTFNFTIVATDSAPTPFVSAPVVYSLTVTAPSITVSPTSLPDGSTAAAYSQTFTASGGVGAYTFAVTAGALPGGLSLAADGALTGAPDTAGTFSFTVTAADSLGFTGDQTFSITIADPVITVTAPAAGALASGQVGSAYHQTFTATGGQGTHSFALDSGALPAGLALSTTGELSGSPTEAGVFSFSVVAADASPAPGPFSSAPVAYTLEIAGPAIILTPAAGALPEGLRSVAYSQTFSASGGAAPYAFSVTAGALPAGLTLTLEGALSGTPEVAGIHDFTVTTTDAMGFTEAAAYTLEIGTPVPVVEPKTVEAVGGQSVTIDVTQGATGVDITSVAVASPPSNGVAVVQGLTIIYTPSPGFSGTDTFTYTVSNAGGASAPATVTITVEPTLTTGPEKTVTVLAGLTAVVDLTDGATGGPFTGAAVVSVSPTDAGATSIRERTGPDGPLYDLVFTPADAFSGQATVLYTLSNAFATSAPGTVTITVEARPDPSLDPDVRGVASSQVNAARRFADAQIDNFQRRLRDLRDGDNASSNGLSLNLGRDEDLDPRQALRRELGVRDHDQVPGAQTPDLEREMMGLDIWAGRRGSGGDHSGAPGAGGDGALGAAASGGAGQRGGDVGFWIAGAIDWGRQDATGVRDSRFTTHGVTVGVDTRLSDRLIVGGGVGYGEDKTRIGDNGSVSNGRALSGALYASWRPAETIYLDGLIGLADLDFDSRRWAQGLAGQPDAFVDGERSGEVVFTSATIGRLMRRGGWTTDLYARLDAREITLDAFTETGSDLAALAWDEARQSSVSANLGAEWRWLVETRNFGSIAPTVGLEWSYELEGIGTQGLRYADWAGSPTYWTPLDGWSRNALGLNLGAEWSLSDRLKLSLGYRGMLGDASSSHGGELRANYRW